MIEETPEAKLKRHEDALVACMTEITKLREENNRLRATANATAGAHDVLRELYLDPDTPPALRAKCAIGALPHETPRLMPERRPSMRPVRKSSPWRTLWRGSEPELTG
jgi:hypothetical protein